MIPTDAPMCLIVSWHPFHPFFLRCNTSRLPQLLCCFRGPSSCAFATFVTSVSGPQWSFRDASPNWHTSIPPCDRRGSKVRALRRSSIPCLVANSVVEQRKYLDFMALWLDWCVWISGINTWKYYAQMMLGCNDEPSQKKTRNVWRRIKKMKIQVNRLDHGPLPLLYKFR